jgi:hypothetical protein
MSRDLTAAAQDASQAGVVRPVMLVELDFPSGFVRVNSSDRTIALDPGGSPSQAEDFLGVGRLGGVSTVGESSELQASGVKLSLSGIPSGHIAAAFERAQGRPGRIWLGFLDQTYRLVVDPVLVFSGLIDDTTIDLGALAKVTLSVENRMIAWERPKVRRYTNEDQQQRFADDKFFEFVNPTVEKELLWGVGSTNQVPRSTPQAGAARTRQGPGEEYRGERQTQDREKTSLVR